MLRSVTRYPLTTAWVFGCMSVGALLTWLTS
jgi:hypothetical protein